MMETEEHWQCAILVVDDEQDKSSLRGQAIIKFREELAKLGFPMIHAKSETEAETYITEDMRVSCVLMDFKFMKKGLLSIVRKANKKLPVFLIAKKIEIEKLPLGALEGTTGYFALMEDTGDFAAGRVKDAVEEYMGSALPPFFRALVDYTYKYKYAWHTPGHMGGIAFRKSPAGRFFYDFFGENMLRADLSVSVPELGSLNEHSGVVGDAASEAARIFGADKTYFVTNGTSTANKIIFHGTLTHGDVIATDRNCHKSVMHSIMMTGAVPVYFVPTRNAYGIIGPIHSKEFNSGAIAKKITSCPLAKGKKKAKSAIVTNSTYDGLCYNARAIKRALSGCVENLHFDEAWYAYAAFHPVYEGRFAMHDEKGDTRGKGPNLFASHSTHKVLAALSQSSMVHVRKGQGNLDYERFNEAFMMHTSTSPQYVMIASLDVGAKMMEGEAGTALCEDSILQAIEFRKRMVTAGRSLAKGKKGWWFTVWQPDKISGKKFESVPDKKLARDPSCWVLKAKDKWHGFGDIGHDHVMLDPIKVTILTPGINSKGELGKTGIPAGVVSAFLRQEGVVVEKTGHYSFLCLFTIGTTRGKSGILLNALCKFKELYDRNAPLPEVFPELAAQNAARYSGMTLRSLCDDMHAHMKKRDITSVLRNCYEKLPGQAMTPADAYVSLVRGEVKKRGLSELEGKVCAAMIVPYPPGIPTIMPGEKYSKDVRKIVEYLALCEEFDNLYPGFENEIHGVNLETVKGKKKYMIYCVE